MDLTDVNKKLSDAAYIAIGFGVLTYQKAQVRRRELERQFEAQAGEVRAQLAKVAGEVDERIEPLVEAVEASLDQLEEHLPEQARGALKTARSAAQDARAVLRSRLVAAGKGAEDGAASGKAA